MVLEDKIGSFDVEGEREYLQRKHGKE